MAELVCTLATADQQFLLGNYKMDYNNQPPGGHGKLRALLESLKEDQAKLDNHPIYREGFTDGFQAAQKAHRKLTKALAKVYCIDDRRTNDV
jgi:hypothetical protein